MKFALSNLPGIEYSAARQMGRMVRSVAPMELRQGYMMQSLDEVRHSQLESNTLRHHMRSWRDPAGLRHRHARGGDAVSAVAYFARCSRIS